MTPKVKAAPKIKAPTKVPGYNHDTGEFVHIPAAAIMRPADPIPPAA